MNTTKTVWLLKNQHERLFVFGTELKGLAAYKEEAARFRKTHKEEVFDHVEDGYYALHRLGVVYVSLERMEVK